MHPRLRFGKGYVRSAHRTGLGIAGRRLESADSPQELKGCLHPIVVCQDQVISPEIYGQFPSEGKEMEAFAVFPWFLVFRELNILSC